jgi:threonine dehydratase
LSGDSYSDAAKYCQTRTAETGRTFIHPFDDPLVIAGQGTIAAEILEQLPTTTHIFVPVGGGGLLAGIANYVKAVRPEIQIIGVEPQDSNAMQQSLRQNRRVILPHVGIFADGVAVKQVGEHTFEAARTKVDACVSVSTDAICAAMKSIFEDTRSIVEPAGALGVAGLQSFPLPPNARAVAICSGANMTFERLQQVAERTLIGSGKEALLAIAIPERPGALQAFCRRIVSHRNITEFSYRLRKRSTAQILVGLSIASQDDRRSLLDSLARYGYSYTDLSDDDTAKEHTRYMVGGAPSNRTQELFYNIEFPERPGALVDFLSSLDNRWNISLFHYRSAASDVGRVLIGFEATNTRELERSLIGTGFEFQAAGNVPGVNLWF